MVARKRRIVSDSINRSKKCNLLCFYTGERTAKLAVRPYGFLSVFRVLTDFQTRIYLKKVNAVDQNYHFLDKLLAECYTERYNK